MFADEIAVGFGNLQSDFADGFGCAGAQSQFTILVGDVRGVAGHAIGIENGDAEFADSGEEKPMRLGTRPKNGRAADFQRP